MTLKNRFFVFAVCAVGIAALYFALRLFNILTLPIFTDEAIYVRWSQIAAQDANWRFISLVDGKQPGFVWIAMVLMKFISDPLLAGRLVSVFAGAGSVVGLFFLGNEIFRPSTSLRTSYNTQYKIFSFTKKTVTIGLLSSFIYVIYPFGLVYDRMALYDSLVGFFAVWSLYLLFVLARSLRLDVALIAGIVIGGGLLTKTNAFFSLYCLPFLLALFDYKGKDLKNRVLRFVGLSLVTIVLASALYSILRLSPFYHIIEEKNALFVYPIGEWVKSPFAYFSKNITALVDWVIIYFTIPALILSGVSFFASKEHFREKAVLALWFLFPFAALAFFGNQIYPRFILFMTLSLIPLLSYTLYSLLTKYKTLAPRALIILVAFGLYIYADYFILFNFAKAPIPRADLGQYSNDWTAGAGVRESVEFFKTQAANSKIHIVTQGTFGLMPYALEMYLVDNPNIKIQALWPIKDTMPEEISSLAKKMPVYAVFYQPCPACEASGKIPPLWRAELISTYRQGIGSAYYSVYRILP